MMKSTLVLLHGTYAAGMLFLGFRVQLERHPVNSKLKRTRWNKVVERGYREWTETFSIPSSSFRLLCFSWFLFFSSSASPSHLWLLSLGTHGETRGRISRELGAAHPSEKMETRARRCRIRWNTVPGTRRGKVLDKYNTGEIPFSFLCSFFPLTRW